MATFNDPELDNVKLNIEQRHEFVKVIDNGAFGIIIRTRTKEPERAVKMLEIDDESLIPEMECLRILPRHPNIVHYYDHWIEDTKDWNEEWKKIISNRYQPKSSKMFFIELELCGDNLRIYLTKRDEMFFKQVKSSDILENSNCIQDPEFGLREGYSFNKENSMKHIKIMLDIITGLKILHLPKYNIIHRDLKPENILYGKDGNFKIADFGASRVDKDGSKTEGKGTVGYQAPEQMTKYYDKSVDIYAVGLMYFEIMYPFRAYVELSELSRNLKQKNAKNPRLPMTSNVLFNRVSPMILSMVSKESINRPTLEVILEFCKNLSA